MSQELLDTLRKVGLSEIAERTVLTAMRPSKEGGQHEVEVAIFDYGPGVSLRYHARATRDDGKVAYGNGDDSLQNALVGLHGYELDK